MDAASLQQGFRVGDWLIEPSAARASNGDSTAMLTDDQLQVLLALASHHGEAVDRRSLRAQLWPGQAATDERLRTAVAGLRALFGEKARHPRYIASVGNDAYALIARFELLSPPAAPPAESAATATH
jgi:DNA-binding winged helix-turn-helix (wHTH) protein